MTPATLRTALAALLTSQLGTYTTPSGATYPAIYVGDPPSSWVAEGLEVIIQPIPNIQVFHHHSATGLGRDFHIYLIPRGSGDAQTALERIATAYETDQPVLVPSDEGLGILQQYSLHVRS